MDLKLLAISDTHLGEDTSFLSFPRGLQHLSEILLEKFGEGQKFTIDELILIGDIPDTALSSTSQVITQTNAFIQALQSVANIKKTVYIPGNHDHTLWTDYMRRKHNDPNKKFYLTPPKGELIIENGALVNNRGCELLATIFYGYPLGPAWINIRDSNNKFAVANPLYVVETRDRNYIFTHGTHFKSVVTADERLMKFVDKIQLDRMVAKIEINTDHHVKDATTLKQLEEFAAPFVDSLWIDSRNQPTSRSDHIWYLYHVISNRFEEKREIPARSARNAYSIRQNVDEKIIANLNGSNSIKLLEDFFLDQLLLYLDEENLFKENLTFVYGDTHDGGWGDINRDYTHSANGNVNVKLETFNCGGWVVHDKENHPPCHIFAVENDNDEYGEEFLLDVSFNGVDMLGMPLLELAAQDFENRSQAISFLVRFFIDHFPD